MRRGRLGSGPLDPLRGPFTPLMATEGQPMVGVFLTEIHQRPRPRFQPVAGSERVPRDCLTVDTNRDVAGLLDVDVLVELVMLDLAERMVSPVEFHVRVVCRPQPSDRILEHEDLLVLQPTDIARPVASETDDESRCSTERGIVRGGHHRLRPTGPAVSGELAMVPRSLRLGISGRCNSIRMRRILSVNMWAARSDSPRRRSEP
jgi:hypothetical protein